MKHIEITPVKTYKTAANAHAAVAKKISPTLECERFGPIRYIVTQTEDGRYYPLFIGVQALHYGIHQHFCVIN